MSWSSVSEGSLGGAHQQEVQAHDGIGHRAHGVTLKENIMPLS
jgi:hypothetical protein